MLEGINGQPYLDLDQYLDIDKIKKMHLDICFGIAQAGCLPTVYFPPKSKDEQHKDMNEAAICDDPKIAQPYKLRYNMLQSRERQLKFAELANDVVLSGSVLHLRAPYGDEYKNIYSRNKCFDSELQVYFRPLLKHVFNILPFKSIGRVIIFISNPGVTGQIHSDFGTNKKIFPPYDNKNVYKHNHFIWFNPTGKKKFFVYDQQKKEKIYIQSTSCFFNTWDWHGSDPTETTTYSLRVDGKFTNAFAKRVGLP